MELEKILNHSENENFECKEALNRYDFEKMVKYCAALANEGGGYFILGVSDKVPRTVIGTSAFPNLAGQRTALMERLHLRIETQEFFHKGKRIVIFKIPSHPVGLPVQYKGAYWMRSGDSLTPMSQEQLKVLLNAGVPDYSAEICKPAKLTDLDEKAIEIFRNLWIKKSGNQSLKMLSKEQLLADAELIYDKKLTFASLILLGKNVSIGRLLPQSEIIYEFKVKEKVGPPDNREEFREGFFLFYDKIWEHINARNSLQHYQEGPFVYDIPYFNQSVVREILLNAAAHRDYRLPGSVFVRQFLNKLSVSSPGGFITGISPENIIWKQAPRNRRIAEVFSKCGFVERSGQGMDLIYQNCICESKELPDFSGTDDYEVCVTLNGEVHDKDFIRFIEQLGKETLLAFAPDDFIVLDCIAKRNSIPDRLKDRIPILTEMGVIEKIGHGRGVKTILSRKYFEFKGNKDEYSKVKGLDRETNKTLILRYIEDNNKTGVPISELQQVLPTCSRDQIKYILKELKSEDKIALTGRGPNSKWHMSRFMKPKTQ